MFSEYPLGTWNEQILHSRRSLYIYLKGSDFIFSFSFSFSLSGTNSCGIGSGRTNLGLTQVEKDNSMADTGTR
jgi:hypothetical protein